MNLWIWRDIKMEFVSPFGSIAASPSHLLVAQIGAYWSFGSAWQAALWRPLHAGNLTSFVPPQGV